MTITLAEAKNFLRVDSNDDDALITSLITSATERCAQVARLTLAEYQALTSVQAKDAVVFTIAYLYESREDADFEKLNKIIRASLLGLREGAAF